MVVRILSEQPLGPQTVRGTVLFADLRGYTALAERLAPEAVVGLLDEFFSILAGAVGEHGGAVYHMAGDSVMAGFGLSDPSAVPVRAAVAAGRTMVASFTPVAAGWARSIGVITGVGIGVHAGDLALAPLGPPAMRRPTLIGDTVNVASRLCQRARAGEVLFSASVADALERAAFGEVMKLPHLKLRGRAAPIQIFCVPARERVTPAAAAPRA